MDPLLPEIASAMSEVQIGTLFRLAELAPAAAIGLVTAVLAAVVALVRFDVDSHEPLPH